MASEPKDSRAMAPSAQEESIMQLEQELLEVRNAMALKDMMVSELMKDDASAPRLKREIRALAEELHHTRKELSQSMMDLQELQTQLNHENKDGSGAGPRDVVESATPAVDAERMSGLQAENRELREKVSAVQAQLQQRSQNESALIAFPSTSPQNANHQWTAPREAGYDTGVFRPNPSLQRMGDYAGTGPGVSVATGQNLGGAETGMNGLAQHNRYASIGSGGSNSMQGTGVLQLPVDDSCQPIVYSSLHHGTDSTLGHTHLQGIGVVDGAAAVAKILLGRMTSSVMTTPQQRRPMALGHMQMGMLSG